MQKEIGLNLSFLSDHCLIQIYIWTSSLNPKDIRNHTINSILISISDRVIEETFLKLMKEF